MRLAGDAHRDVVGPGEPAVGRDGGDDRLRLAEAERVRVAGGGVVADRRDPVGLHDGVVVGRVDAHRAGEGVRRGVGCERGVVRRDVVDQEGLAAVERLGDDLHLRGQVVVAEVDDAAVARVRCEPLPVLLDRVFVQLIVEAAVAVRVRRRRRPLPVEDRLADRGAVDLQVRLVDRVVRTHLDVAVLALRRGVGDVETLEARPVRAAHEGVARAEPERPAEVDVVLRVERDGRLGERAEPGRHGQRRRGEGERLAAHVAPLPRAGGHGKQPRRDRHHGEREDGGRSLHVALLEVIVSPVGRR